MKTGYLAALLMTLLPSLSAGGERAPKMILGWLETTSACRQISYPGSAVYLTKA